MAESKQQSFVNHARWDPPYHYFLVPVTMINVIVTIVHLVRAPSLLSAWIVVLALAAVVVVMKLRLYPLKAQDRVIRLEERMRLEALLSDPAARAKILELREGQLVALRFAPDNEVPALVDQALSQHLGPKEIKQKIQNWRADHFRVLSCNL